MKILVIGGSGVIGSKIVRNYISNKTDVEFTYLKNDLPYGKGTFLDITHTDATIKIISKINPDVVIHTAALTNVDVCETDPKLADSINVEGTANVIEGCRMARSKIVYISTSSIFDGRKQQYSEEDVASSSTYYGITKFEGEEMVKRTGLPFLILRTDQPYCWIEKWQHTNSVLRVIQTLKSGRVLKEIVDWYNTPTYVPDFVHATKRLIDENQEGIFHLVGSDHVNRYNWSLLVADIFGLDKKMIKPISSDTLNLPAKRVNVNLSNQKLFQKTGIRMMGIKEGLMKMLNN